MLTCPVCKKAEFYDTNDLSKHIKIHEREGHFKNSAYYCGNCPRSYPVKYSWIRHVKSQHSDLIEINLFKDSPSSRANVSNVSSNQSFSSSLNISGISAISNAELDSSQESNVFDVSFEEEPAATTAQDIENQCVRLVGNLRSHSSTTLDITELAVAGGNELVSSVVDYLKNEVKHRLKELGTDDPNLLDKFDSVREPLTFLSTAKKQNAYFNRHPTYVTPIRTAYGPFKWVSVRDKEGKPSFKRIQHSYEYVPITQTLKSVLSNQRIRQLIESRRPRKDGVIEDWIDGESMAEHPLFSDFSKTALALDLYYDDFECANPLGSKAGIHKVGVFYFRIRNLPASFNSSMVNIHLLAIAYTGDLKSYGYAPVLERIAEEIKQLETEGFSLPNEETHKLYAFISTVSGDNLGLHSIFGFLESFRAHKPCIICMADKSELQTKFKDSDFILRTTAQYEEQLSEIKSDKTKQKQSLYGIKDGCPLNSTSWHVTRNCAADLMHDFLEGFGPFELKILLKKFIEDGLFTVDQLADRINNFSYGRTDAKNRPVAISKETLASDGHTLKQKALPFWCLFRLLPQLISKFISPNNAYWQLYIELRTIADLLFAPRWTFGMIQDYSVMYAAHLQNFKNLFPSVSLIPKAHFLTHYGRICQRSGPPYKLMVAPQEQKGNWFKRYAGVMCNFRNVPHTFAQKHQFQACLNTMGDKHWRFDVTVKLCEQVMASEIDPDLRKRMKISDQIVTVATKLSITNQTYAKNDILIVAKDEESGWPIFGKLLYTLTENCTHLSVRFVYETMDTVAFEPHLYGYSVKLSNKKSHIASGDLIDYHPLDLYIANDSNYLVVLRYKVI